VRKIPYRLLFLSPGLRLELFYERTIPIREELVLAAFFDIAQFVTEAVFFTVGHRRPPSLRFLRIRAPPPDAPLHVLEQRLAVAILRREQGEAPDQEGDLGQYR
jgi:hypothetical protein